MGEKEEQQTSGKGESLREAMALFSYLRPYNWYFVPAMLAMFLTGMLVLSFPHLMGELTGGVMGGGGDMDVDAVLERRNRVALTLVAVLSLQAVVAFFRISWFAKAGESALADMRRDVFGHMVRLPMAFFDRHRVGELTSRMASDLTLIRDTLVSTVPQFLRQTITLIGSLIMIFVTSPRLSLFMLACLPVVILLASVFGRRIRASSKQAQDELAESNVIVEETLQAVTDVKGFTNERYESGRYGEVIGGFLDFALRVARYRAAFVAFIVLVLFGVITLVVWYGAGLLAKPVDSGGISPSQFMQFVLYTVFLGGAIGSLPEALSQIQKCLGATERVREILRETREKTVIVSQGEKVRMVRARGSVEVRDLSFCYPNRKDVRVLKEVSLRADPGESVAVVGPSGAGKSTLIALLMRFYNPDSGVIRLDGEDHTAWDLEEWRRQFAIVPQEVLLFGGSIRENIAYGGPGAGDKEIEEAARQAHAHEFISRFPDGYATTVGDRGVRLSGGQRQRVAIARAVLADPAVLILDEATSALDSESERKVQDALEHLMLGRTTFVIAHRLATVKAADRIVVLSGGEVVETGTHAELSGRDSGLYSSLARLQFQMG